MSDIDISIYIDYPFKTLSNLHKNPFIYDGVECAGMEGFLQSLKFENEHMQRKVCLLYGARAKGKGAKVEWWQTQTLFWKGKQINRHSNEYQILINEAYYYMMISNENYQEALLATEDNNIVHTLGNDNAKKTILTEREFCDRLLKMREALKGGNI